MWNLYAAEAGVAIKTHCQSLADSITDYEIVYIGKINYVGYDSSFFSENNAFSAFLHKRKSFEHEQEVRALTSDLTKETNWHEDAKESDKYCAVDR